MCYKNKTGIFIFQKLLIFGVVMISFFSFSAQAQENNNDDVRETEEEVVERNFSIEDFIRGALAVVPEVVEVAQDVIEQISEGEYEDVYYSVRGAVGLFDPLTEANETGTNPDSIYGTTATPPTIDAKASDTQQSQTSQRLSQIIFSEPGQEAIAEQNEIIVESQEGANEAQEATVEAYEANEAIIGENVEYGNNIEDEANEAQAARASQDVLKALASQADYEAQILVGISEQISIIAENQVYSSVQTKTLNTQLAIVNQRNQNIQTYLASNGLQMSEIDNNLEQQIELIKKNNEKERLRSQMGMSTVFLPGLYSVGEEEENE